MSVGLLLVTKKAILSSTLPDSTWLKQHGFITHKAQHGDIDWLGWFSATRGQVMFSETLSSRSALGPC